MRQHHSFAAWLRQVRQELHFSQEQFAQALDYATVTYRKVERGLPPSPAFLERLAAHLGLPPGEAGHLRRFASSGDLAEPLSLPAYLAHLQPGVAAAPPPIHTLPVAPSRLVGREHEVAMLAGWLRHPQHRLITLVGPPGVGKTRLAQAVAWETLPSFGAGTFYVDLLPLTTPREVWTQVAATVGKSSGSDAPVVEQIAAALGPDHALLVFDNGEHLADLGPELAPLLGACPGLKVLLTSRVPLNVRVERLFWVHPFPVPDPVQSQPAEIWANPAVLLFCERAQAVNPLFEYPNDQAATIAAICRQLDGLPLAIELAAVRSQFIAPASLLERLSKRLAVLTGGARDGAAHQSTLRRAIEWSYRLLDDAERALFNRMSIFPAPCSVEAIADICGADLPDERDPLDLVASLVSKSLIVHRPDAEGKSRFGMLATLREFAAEALAEQEPRVLARYMEHYVALAETLDAQLRGPRQIALLNAMEAEHLHWQTILRLSAGTGKIAPDPADAARFVRLFAALAQFWYGRGHFIEAWQWLASLDRSLPLVGVVLRARAALGAGIVTTIHHQSQIPTGYLETGVDLWQGLGQPTAVATCRLLLGMVATRQHDYRRSAAALADSLGFLGQTDEHWLLSLNYFFLAQLNIALADLAEAEEDLRRCEALPHLAQDPFRVSWLQSLSGQIAYYRGRLDVAAALHVASLEIRQSIGIKGDIAVSWLRLGQTVLGQGRLAEARAAFAESLTLWRVYNSEENVLQCLEGYAALHLAEDRPFDAALVLSAATNQRERSRLPHPPVDAPAAAALLTAIKQRLGCEQWGAANQRGRAAALPEVIALVLAEAECYAASLAGAQPVRLGTHQRLPDKRVPDRQVTGDGPVVERAVGDPLVGAGENWSAR